jgi:uncharacterized protein involved in response to NO
MGGRPVRYEAEKGGSPLWASEPFRLFFPLGILAGIFGLLLWPLHYAGWWGTYPAIQHPRILIFGFGAAFVFGFLGTAWPRFLEARALLAPEALLVAFFWLLGQISYSLGLIARGDRDMALAGFLFLLILARRLFGKGRELPPPGFALAFVAVGLAAVTLGLWHWEIAKDDVPFQSFLRLLAYQGFLLLPLLGVGSYLFARFFASPGRPPAKVRWRGPVVSLSAVGILASLAVEAWLSVRWGSALRLVAFLFWSAAAVPPLWRGRAPGTRAWALRLSLSLVALSFLCRAVWPLPRFAFEHLLFLGGFALSILLVADRVVLGHCDDPARVPPRSVAWRWIAWLVVVAAATRATADLVPTTRVSHQIYASLTLAGVFATWMAIHARRFRRRAPNTA